MHNSIKETIAVLGLVAALAIGAAVFVYLPQKRKLHEIRAQIAAQKIRMESVSAEARVVPGMVRQVQSMKARYKGFDRKLPKSRELFGFLEKIGKHLEDAKLSSEGIQPDRPVREGLFHTLPIIMRCQGHYLELTRFLTEIDKMERLTRVQKLLIRAGPNMSDLNIEVHMNIYFTEQ